MASEDDILGTPPVRKAVVEPDDDWDGLSIEELCRPLSAKVMTKARMALTSELGAKLQQSRNIKIPKVRNKW